LCAEIIPQYFRINDDGMSELIGGKDEGVFTRVDALSIDSNDIAKAVEGCPVDIIRMSAT
jgi:ferredoxin